MSPVVILPCSVRRRFFVYKECSQEKWYDKEYTIISSSTCHFPLEGLIVAGVCVEHGRYISLLLRSFRPTNHVQIYSRTIYHDKRPWMAAKVRSFKFLSTVRLRLTSSRSTESASSLSMINLSKIKSNGFNH
jgi:hypothetical protein